MLAPLDGPIRNIRPLLWADRPTPEHSLHFSATGILSAGPLCSAEDVQGRGVAPGMALPATAALGRPTLCGTTWLHAPLLAITDPPRAGD